MCGITGFWLSQPGNDQQPHYLDAMMDRIKHRGPDNKGSYCPDGLGLYMGHRRLSIIDLITGDQPLFNKDKSIAITVNGEIYDYKRIRADLMSRGERFSTKSDCEVIIKLYERHGLDFVKMLRGEFSFALFDHKKQRLILARDRFGIRPMFYHVQQKSIFYGSEIKALMAHPQVPRIMDNKAILHQLMQTMVPGMSAFKDIHSLKAGNMLIVERKGKSLDIRQTPYWDAEFPQKFEYEELRKNKPEYWIEGVREKLIEAVTLRLEADVPVGCYLSGGIDSCSILGLATGAQQSPVKAFTISFNHDQYDESLIAKEMAEAMNANQEIMSLNGEDLYGHNFINTIWHSERTFYNTLGVAKWHMSRRVRDSGYKVVVTGEGSDELFAGYPFLKKDFLLFHDGSNLENNQYHKQMDQSNALFKGAILSDQKLSHPAFESLCGFTPSWIQPWMTTLEMARGLLTDDLQHDLQDYDPLAAIALSLDKSRIDKRHPLDIAQYTWIKTMLEGQILNWGGDRVDMAHSMESRPPFLDHILAEFAFNIPPELRIKGNTEKYVLREAMKGILPKVLYKREKFAFMAPPAHTEKSNSVALEEIMSQYLCDSAIASSGIFDSQRIKEFLNQYRQDQDSTSLVRKDALLNHILGLQILQYQFIQNGGNKP